MINKENINKNKTDRLRSLQQGQIPLGPKSYIDLIGVTLGLEPPTFQVPVKHLRHSWAACSLVTKVDQAGQVLCIWGHMRSDNEWGQTIIAQMYQTLEKIKSIMSVGA